MRRYYMCFITLLVLASLAWPQTKYKEQRTIVASTDLPSYTILRTNEGITVDGYATETDWNASAPIHFIFPWTDITKEAPQHTIARMLWDDTNLYIIYVCNDPYLESEVTEHDGPVYQEDAVEIFVTPNPNDISSYFGYEMNINGTLLDYIAFEGGQEWTKNIHFPWQSEEVKIVTSYTGTLNNPSDVDQGWILEIAIPWANFRHLGGTIPPQEGDLWRLNLNRTKGAKGQFSMWSDSHAPHPSFHHSAYFGKAYFAMQKVEKHIEK